MCQKKKVHILIISYFNNIAKKCKSRANNHEKTLNKEECEDNFMRFVEYTQ